MTKCELGVYLGISTPAVWRAAREGKKVMEKRGMNEFGNRLSPSPDTDPIPQKPPRNEDGFNFIDIISLINLKK